MSKPLTTDNLDYHWIKYDEELEEAIKLLVKAKKALLDAESIWELEKAEVSLIVRSKPAKYGIDGKLSEDIVKQQTLRHERMLEATRVYNRVKHKAEVYQGNINRLEGRRKTLENLVELYRMGYFPLNSKKGASKDSKMRTAERTRLKDD